MYTQGCKQYKTVILEKTKTKFWKGFLSFVVDLGPLRSTTVLFRLITDGRWNVGVLKESPHFEKSINLTWIKFLTFSQASIWDNNHLIYSLYAEQIFFPI